MRTLGLITQCMPGEDDLAGMHSVVEIYSEPGAHWMKSYRIHLHTLMSLRALAPQL